MRILNNVNSRLLTVFLLATPVLATAQEMLFPLNGNPALEVAFREAERRSTGTSRSGDTLSLPFFDDFSEPFSRENFPHDLYPDPEKWIGRKVYVNDHMAVNPISVGVATFDGLDEYGQAYGFGLTLPTAADTLTSRPIDLFGAADTVYLSFHYQAQGYGLAPSANDLLSLEFKDTANAWTPVWQANGYILEDMDFRRAMIPIVEEEYLFRGFQFRFVNYAALAGAVDHWHVDYVTLNGGRDNTDTVYQDVAVTRGTETLLSDYFSMPWTHFKSSETEFMTDVRYFTLRNNNTQPMPSVYRFGIYDLDGEEEYSFSSASVDVNSQAICGNEEEDCSEDNFGSALLDVRYSTENEFSFDSSAFFIETFLSVGGDQFDGNNRVLKKQRFYNYYAHDDGTAEVGYGLGNLQFPGQVAIRYDAVMEDTLRAIQYYLNPVREDLSEEPIRFYVWSGDSVPEEIIYMSEEVFPSYSPGMNFMQQFFFDEHEEFSAENFPNIGGTFFIGWSQQPTQGQKFSIGFDRGRDASDKVFYNIGSSSWVQSTIPGAVMFRPVFGSSYEWTVGLEGQETSTFTAYPNPSTGMIFMNSSIPERLADVSIAMFDLSGREVMRQSGYVHGIDATGLRPGLYLLTVTDGMGHRSTQRIIIQH